MTANIEPQKRPSYGLPKSVYFLYNAAAAALLPFLALYYHQLGLNGRQIGFLTGLMPLVILIGASIWGAIADASRRHHFILLIAIAGAWLSVLFLSLGESFYVLIPLVTLFAFFMAPLVPLIDNAVLHLLGDRRSDYGNIRLWGSLGWGLVGAATGWAIGRFGLDWSFYLFFILMAGLFFVVIPFPVTGGELSQSFRRGLRHLLANGQWLLFLFIVLLEGMSLNIFLNFLFLYANQLGTSELIMGLSLAIATLSEIPIWIFGHRLLERWGIRPLIIFSLVMFIIRTFAYSFMTAPWQLLVINLLHGPGFAAMWTAGVMYANKTAPEGLGATAQGLFAGTLFGLGAALGSFAGGIMFDGVGPVAMFRITGIGLIVGLVVYLVAGKNSTSKAGSA